MDTLKKDLLALFQKLKGILKGSPWENEYAKSIDEMSSELDSPCVLAVAGMMKTGKSSFINAFLRGDYAAVGKDETTATINYFCYDKNLNNVPDRQKPILCVKVDGSREWVTKSYLDSLQGNSEDILNKSMEINYLEYFLDNPVLDGIRLVDTPGIGAVINYNEHDNRTMSFVNGKARLRERHSEETKQLAQEADALICLIDSDTPNSQDYDLLKSFQNNFKTTSDSDSNAVLDNLIIIMGRADLNNDLFDSEKKKQDYLEFEAKQFKDKKIFAQLSSVSAAMETALTRIKKDDLFIMHQAMQDMPQGDIKCEEDFWDDSSYSPSTAFTSEQRKKITDNAPWSVVKRIIEEFVKEKDFDKALKELKRKAGFEQIREILDEKFFKRGKHLHYYRKLNDLLNWVNDIKERYIPFRRERIIEQQKEIKNIVESNPDNVICLLQEYDKLQCELESLIVIKFDLEILENDAEKALRFIELERDKYNALIIINKNSELFTSDETEELKHLFSTNCNKNSDLDLLNQRALYWEKQGRLAKNKDRLFVSKFADKLYRTIIKDYYNL